MTNKEAADILKAFVEGCGNSEHADLMRLYLRGIEVFEKAIEALEKADEKEVEPEPICDSMGDLIKRCSASYDDFLLECFKPFGITKDNVLSWIDRIHKREYSDLETDAIYHRYFIDGTYAFTVSVIRSISDDHIFTQEHRKFIEEDLKKGGETNDDDK